MTLFFFIFTSFLQAQIDYHSIVDSTYFFSQLNDPFDNGYPETKYQEVISIVKKTYDPIIKALGGELFILDDWTDGAVNAWANRLGQEYWLEIPGGLSRYHLINEEAFVVTICHEIGHLLGKEPLKNMISFEGQADYYATNDCIDNLLSQITALKILPNDTEVQALCNDDEDSLCQRSLKGSLSITSYFAEIANQQFPRFSTPSTVKVKKTLEVHPPAQCRLDTLKAGYFNLLRPECWYLESSKSKD
jgi:hypothetical protein